MVFRQWLHHLLLFSPLLCHCAFNDPTNPNWCWRDNCVRHHPYGTCYDPSANNNITSNACDGGHENSPDYQDVLNAHLKQGLSIAYYSNSTFEQLGGINYTIPPNTTVSLCLSGKEFNGAGYQTMCVPADTDNDITKAGAYCWVRLAQDFVTDNCYVVTSKNSSASPSSTTNSSSSISSSSSPSSLSPSGSSSHDIPIVPIVVPATIVVVIILLGLIFGKATVNYVQKGNVVERVIGGQGGDGGRGQSGGRGGEGGGVNLETKS